MLRLMPRPLQFAFQSAGPPPARSLSGRLCRDASSPLPPSPDVGEFIRGAAFPIARAGLRRPQMRSAAECSRPAALFRPSDGFSARPGNVAAPCGGVHSGSGNEPPVRSLSGRLCRDASSSRPPSPDVGKFIRGAAFPIARAGLRRPLMRSAVECSRPAALFRAPDGLSARPGMSPPRAAGGIPAPATNRPHRTAPEVRPPPGAAAATVQLSGSPLPVPMRKRLACAETGVHAARAAMRPARPKHEVRTGAARRFRPNHAVRPPLADVRLFGNGSARNIERGQSAPPRNSHIRENPGSAERTERGGRAASIAGRKIRMLRDAESPGEARKAPPRRA